MLRRSCGVCPFTNLQRPSDITLGDFWGSGKTDPNFNKDNKGVSLVLVNTEKGKRIFDAVRKDLDIREAKLDNVLQPNLVHPTEISLERDAFEMEYLENGFDLVYEKYGKVPLSERVTDFLKVVTDPVLYFLSRVKRRLL